MNCKHNWHPIEGTERLRCQRCKVETGPKTPEERAQDMLKDIATIGSAWSKNGERIDPVSVYKDFDPRAMEHLAVTSPVGFKFHDPRPSTITFFGMKDNANIEVMRLSRDGIWVNPDIPTDEAAKKVLEALDRNIKLMVDKERERELNACCDLLEGMHVASTGSHNYYLYAAVELRKLRKDRR